MSILSVLVAPRSNRPGLLTRALNAGALAVRSAFAPETLFVASTPEPAFPVELSTETTELTAVEDAPVMADWEVEQACADYAAAADQARAADRAKRKAKGVIGKLPVGIYGGWSISRKSSSRQTPDLERIAALFEAHGLGPVPMRPVADSLVVTRVSVEELAA